jgi:hypothetical protein
MSAQTGKKIANEENTPASKGWKANDAKGVGSTDKWCTLWKMRYLKDVTRDSHGRGWRGKFAQELRVHGAMDDVKVQVVNLKKAG